MRGLLSPDDPVITSLANFSSAVKSFLDKVSWVGFYLWTGDELVLGPFQGKPACTRIRLGQGVCGFAAEKGETVIVSDVHTFPGHIACDDGSNSEIVVPFYTGGTLAGVLDLDSYRFDAFDEMDKKYLEQMTNYLAVTILRDKAIRL
jgi:GAF domain-containing protein